MILCIGPNPSLDRTIAVDELRIGEVHRSQQSVVQAGGKAANVARTLGVLNAQSRLLGVIGGGIGAEIADLAAAEGLDSRWARTGPSTRVCFTVVSPDGVVTDVNEAGRVDGAGWSSFLELVAWEAKAATAVLLCGSFPQTERDDAVGEMLAAIGHTAPLWVDTSGSSLRRMLDAERVLDVVKVNRSEAAAVLDRDQPDAEPMTAGRELAAELAARTGGIAVVTLGEHGAVVHHDGVTTNGVLRTSDVVNPTGSGDAFFGGLACGLIERSTEMREALALALACGASNARQLPAGQPIASDVAVLLGDVHSERLT